MLNPQQFGEFSHEPTIYPTAEQNPVVYRFGGAGGAHVEPNEQRVQAAMSPGGTRVFRAATAHHESVNPMHPN